MTKKQIRIVHPIDHDQVVYGRGLHELEEALADQFVAEFPNCAVEYKPPVPVRGTTNPGSGAQKPKPPNPKGGDKDKDKEKKNELIAGANESDADIEARGQLALEMFVSGNTVAEVADTLGITLDEAAKLQPKQ